MWTSLRTLALALLAVTAHAQVDHGYMGNRARERIARHADHQLKRMAAADNSSDTHKFRYLTDKTKKFRVTSLPEVHYDIGEMYAGQIPIVESKPGRNLFFVFQPTVGAPVDEVTIWLNGGPGCSSLEGFFQENGLFRWGWGVYRPLLNPYSWVNLTNMLWVEQPVGTGFSQGEITAKNERDIAQDFIKWFKNFQTTFGIKKYKIFVTGESYAGRYVPYISTAMINQNDTEYYNVKGALMYDPCIGDCGYVQTEVPAYPLIEKNANLFNLNSTQMDHLRNMHESCGYADYLKTYMQFPPKKAQPSNLQIKGKCDVNGLAEQYAIRLNPCFNPYELVTMCELPYDVLGFPTAIAYTPEGATNYFDRTDVKKAIHAPLDVTWGECSDKNVFPHGDASPDPIHHVLPKVIEHTNRVLVANGDYDIVVITDGTLLAIQNMTWNGKMGFQKEPSTPLFVDLPDLEYQYLFTEQGIGSFDGDQGVMGLHHTERGLLFARTYQSGHMQPQFQSRVSYKHLQWLLGRIENL